MRTGCLGNHCVTVKRDYKFKVYFNDHVELIINSIFYYLYKSIFDLRTTNQYRHAMDVKYI